MRGIFSAKKGQPKEKGTTRPRFWLSLLILLAVLVLAGLGQWDFVVAVVIGLLIGNVGSWLLGWD